MKFIALLIGWAVVLAGAAAGAIVVESLLHRRRMRREAELHSRLGVGGNAAAKRR